MERPKFIVGVTSQKQPAAAPKLERPVPTSVTPRTRRKIKVGEYELYKLARMGCTKTEAAQWFGIARTETLQQRMDEDDKLALAWDRGQAQSKISLRRLQHAHATRPGPAGVAMTIHMSKHQLGEVDKQEVKHTGAHDGPIEVTFSFDSPAAKSLAANSHGSGD